MPPLSGKAIPNSLILNYLYGGTLWKRLYSLEKLFCGYLGMFNFGLRFKNVVPAIFELIFIFKGFFELVLREVPFYFMEFIVPKFEYGKKKIGVYRIWLNEQWLYIGSSKNLRSRFNCWKSKFKTGRLDKHVNIKQILPLVETVRFEILKEYNHPSYLRRKETEYLKEYWDNPLLLNRCPDGSTNKNPRPYNGYVKPVKIKKPFPERMKPKKVAVFTNDGSLIKICNSTGEFEREFKMKREAIHKILSGKRGQPRAFKIKGVDDFGNCIEPKPFVNVQHKRVIQMDKNGMVIAEYNSISEAARYLGDTGNRTHLSNLQKVLHGQYGYKTVRGYIWKYA